MKKRRRHLNIKSGGGFSAHFKVFRLCVMCNPVKKWEKKLEKVVGNAAAVFSLNNDESCCHKFFPCFTHTFL